MSQQYPPPPGVDSRRPTYSGASRYGQPPPPGSAYGAPPPPPPNYGAPPPPPPQHSNHSSTNYDSYASNRYDDRDRDRDRARDRDRDRGRDDRDRDYHGDRSGRNGRDRDRDRDRDYRDDRYQPSRRNDNYPPPSRPQDSQRDRRGGDSFRPPHGDFTFRADKPAGVGDLSNNYRPADSNAPHAPYRGPSNGFQGAGRGRGARGGGRGARRGPWRPFQPSERALLQDGTSGLTTMDFADEENGPTFKPLDQLSDSDEAEMDMSDSDNQSGERTVKRTRTTTKADDGDSVPKWSNPDPYTALPPTEDADKKKKDMVQLIRKARIESLGARTSLAAPGTDQDFLGFGSDSDESQDDSDDFIDPLTYNRGSADEYAPRGAGNAPGNAPHPLPNKPGSASTSKPGQVASQVADHTGASGLGKQQKIVIDLTQSPKTAGRRAAQPIDLTQSSDLGSRKRTHDDVLKLPAHAQLKQAPSRAAGGKVASSWQTMAGEPNCPWVQIPTSQVLSSVRFHMEVTDFYDYIKPRQFEERIRAQFVDDLNSAVTRRLSLFWPGFKDCLMYPFGSYMSGLYLPTGDMDLVLCSKTCLNGGIQRPPGKSQLWKFVNFVRTERLAAGNQVNPILGAKVPIVQYVDKTTGLKVDISFENTSGLVAVNTFKAWKEQWPVMPILVTIIKQFLLMRGLNEPVNGGIGGFSVTCMVVSMLQHMPPLQSGDMEQRHDLGSLLMHFFDLYGNRFNYETVALSVNPPAYIAKSRVRDVVYRPDSQKKISILDPNNPANDIAGGSKNFAQIAASFSSAHKLLQERIQQIAAGDRFDSILVVILGGNYSSFREQRDYLRNLHLKVHGYCDE